MNRTAEQMYEDIRNWEMEAGESFLDYFDGSLNEYNLLFWAMGKGYITDEGFREYETRDTYSYSNDDIIYGYYSFSIVKETDDYEEGYEKAMRILAEFLVTSETYQKRVDRFLNNIHKIKLEDVMRNLFRERVFFINKGERVYVKGIEGVLQVPIGQILSTQWYVDRNELEEEE